MVILSVSETNITSSGKVRLTVDVHAPRSVPVTFPEIAAAMESFEAADEYAEPVQTLPNGRQLYRRTWLFVPDLPGKRHLLPLEFSIGSTVIQTEPVAITVESVLPKGMEHLEIRDIAEPAALLPQDRRRHKHGLMLAAVLAFSGGLFLLIRRLRRKETVPPPAPHEAALHSFQDLPDDPLERIHALNRILRAYLEARFNLPAVGKTAHEVLLMDVPFMNADIAGFLEAGEAFRFSHWVPAGFAEESEERIRQFIEQTAEEPCS